MIGIVFAGAFTTEVYQYLFNKYSTEKQLVFVGRIFTVALGCIVIAGSLLIPRYGYTRFIIDLTTLLTGPLVLPTLWGLFSKKIGIKAVWSTTLIGFVSAGIVKFGLSTDGFLTGFTFLNPISDWVITNMRISDLTSRILVPFTTLFFLEIFEKEEQSGWERIQTSKQTFYESKAVQSATMPARMVAITLAVIATMMMILAIINQSDATILLGFALTLYLIAVVVYLVICKSRKGTD